jgi:hypothetical protein
MKRKYREVGGKEGFSSKGYKRKEAKEEREREREREREESK